MTLTLKHFAILSDGDDNLNERAYHLRADGPQHLSATDLRDAARRMVQDGAERLGVDVKDFTVGVSDAHPWGWWSDWACLAQRAAPAPKGWTEIVA